MFQISRKMIIIIILRLKKYWLPLEFVEFFVVPDSFIIILIRYTVFVNPLMNKFMLSQLSLIQASLTNNHYHSFELYYLAG